MRVDTMPAGLKQLPRYGTPLSHRIALSHIRGPIVQITVVNEKEGEVPLLMLGIHTKNTSLAR